jgi:tetratricopeptide (TPR) repeat protein
MKSYLPIILITIVFFANSTICNGQLSETNKLLIKARSLQGHNSVRNKVAQDIYNNLIAKEPTNAVFYVESGFFNLNHADKELGMSDLNMAMYLLENKICAYNNEPILEDHYNDEKEIFVCSLELLEKVYREKWKQFDKNNELDSSAIYIKKLIRLYTDSSGIKPDYSKFKDSSDALYTLNSMYEEQAQNYVSLNHYREALLSFKKMITDMSNTEKNIKYIDLYTMVGEYDSVIQIMKREIFIQTDSGIRFTKDLSYKTPRYFIDYVSAYIAKRDFENADNLLTNNTTIVNVPNSNGVKMNILLKEFPMYQKRESDNICERINQYEEEYSYYHFYSCVLNDLKNKHYEIALLHLNNFYKIMEPAFLKLGRGRDSRLVKYIEGEIFRFEYAILSLKGYLLSKLNKNADAKLAYQEAIKLNPSCKEAKEELKGLQ